MGLIRITSAESDAEKDITNIPALFHVEFIATERNEEGITIRYDITLAFKDFPFGCFFEIFKIKIFTNKKM